MRTSKRTRGAFILLALFTFVTAAFAQDDPTDVTAAGSGLVLPLLEEIVASSETDITINTDVTGTADGFAQFCTGEAQLITSNRPISVEEEALCTENEVVLAELLLAHEVLTIVANPADEFLTCLTNPDLNSIFAPSATGQFMDWSQLSAPTTDTETDEAAEDQPVSVWLPTSDTLAFLLLDNVVDGLGFRSDANTGDFSTVLEEVSNTEGAIGVVPLQALTASDADVIALDLNVSGVGCAAPTAEAVEDSSYGAATTFYLYINETIREPLADLLTFIGSESGVETISTAGYTPISADASETNTEVITGEEDGRAFTAEAATYTIPPVLEGTLAVVGDPQGFGWTNSVATQLSGGGQGQQAQQNLTININTFGDNEGVTEFCADETGNTLLLLDTAFDGNTITCEPAEGEETPTEVEVVSFYIGAQATVLLGNGSDDFNTCLTLEQIETIWGADEAITNWNALGDDFPDQELTLFGIGRNDVSGSIYTDLLLNPFGDNSDALVRGDTEFSADALFRAAATANVPGALTYMSWPDYVAVVDNEQSNIRFVSVDAGAGCAIPSTESILDGDYPLSSSLTVVVRQTALADVVVQSYLWTLFDDANVTRLENDDFVGLDNLDLPDLREDLLVEFNLAVTAAAEAAAAEAESTAEAPEAEATEETDGE